MRTSAAQRSPTPTWLAFWLIAVMSLAGFLRLWNLSENVMFQGDQGRDAMIAARIFRDQDLVFIGPVMSVGNMYLGPLYYYMMVIPLWLSYPSPLGPAYATALAGILTVWLIYVLGKKLVGQRPALIGMTLYALSSLYVVTTRFSWNPNTAPLFGLLVVYWTYMAWRKNRWYWALVFGGFAVLIQLHYVNLLAAGGFGIIWLLQFKELWQADRSKLKGMVLATVVGLLILAASLTPLMLFDLRHDWLNARAFASLVTSDDNFTQNSSATLLTKILKIARETHGRSMHLLFEMTLGRQRLLNTILVLGVIVAWVVRLLPKSKHHLPTELRAGLIVIVTFIAVGIAGTSVYQHSVFDHYFGFLYPAAALGVAVFLDWLWQLGVVGRLGVLGFAGVFLLHNVTRYPLAPGNNRLADLQFITQTILNRVKPDSKYNIVLLSETGDIDGMKYRYFLETSAHPPVPQDRRGEIDTLFIINEDHKLARVVDSPIYEIVVFPNHDPSEVYALDQGPEITVLEKKPSDR